MRVARVLALWFGLACVPPLAPSTDQLVYPTAVTRAAADSATACGRQHALRPVRAYADLQLYTSPDLGEQGGHPIVDFGLGNRVWVLAGYEGVERVWYHAFLHVLFGLPGTTPDSHPRLFLACGILVI